MEDKEVKEPIFFKFDKYYHSRPLPNQQYFLPLPNNKIIPVIIPFYNEKYAQVRKTLESLHYCQQYIEDYTFTYFLIQDGWQKAHKSVREVLPHMFPGCSYWDELKSTELDSIQKVTYIFQRQKGNYLAPSPIPDEEKKTQELLPAFGQIPPEGLHLALVIKKDNRKKHNSHEWFLSKEGYCGVMNPEYCVATDCSTLYEKKCFYYLLN